MNMQEVAVKSLLLKYSLQSDTQNLDEVVVTAMGITRSEKTLGIQQRPLRPMKLSAHVRPMLPMPLSGKVAGLSVSSTSSDPGSVSNIVIRGFSSINGSNQPLYVVDGVPLQNNMVSGDGKNVSTGGISSVASEDIASMTVLKAEQPQPPLYGSRAANGVIVITTKSGKKGDGRNFSISYSGNVQARMVSFLPEMQNSFGQGWNGAQTYIENGSWGPRLDGSMQVYGPIWNNQQLIHEYSAKKDNIKDFFDPGWSQNHTVSLSGVSADTKMDYYLSYSFYER